MLGDLGLRVISFHFQFDCAILIFFWGGPLVSIKYMYFPIDISSHQVGLKPLV